MRTDFSLTNIGGTEACHIHLVGMLSGMMDPFDEEGFPKNILPNLEPPPPNAKVKFDYLK